MRRGFSLIEVLVAALLLLLVLVVVLTPITRSRASLNAAQNRLQALQLADLLLHQVYAPAQGQATIAQRAYLYNLQCNQVETDLYRVDLEIRWDQTSLHQQTYLYGVEP